ncbi:MAG: hypothetical protein ACUVWB_10325 [Anaerolineae bacterium]
MERMEIEPGLYFERTNLVYNPDDDWYAEFLKPYYAVTKDGQYLFACLQAGRAPSRAFHMDPVGYRLGRGQQRFAPGVEVGRRFIQAVKDYLTRCKVIVLDGIQGEAGYETGVRVVISIQNPHSAYIGWMGRQMIFPYKPGVPIRCWNYIVPEPLPADVVAEIKTFYPDYEENLPISLYDWTRVDEDVRQVVSVRFDYFGAAFKKPNLTLVWNRGEADGCISYHAGATRDRILKGLSGTGKTTLSVGPDLEQDDACLGRLYVGPDGKVEKVQIIGLEAASFAKSEGLTPESPEWVGLMKSRQVGPDGRRPIVLVMNVDCKGVEYRIENIAGYQVKVPRPIPGEEVGSLQPTRYEKSKTTNGRFIFRFSELNPNWGSSEPKWLRSEGLSFKRFDILEPIIRVVDPYMAVALDSACESIITSALSDQPVGTRVRSYAATDFMAREQAQQALLKLRVYRDLGLGPDGKLVFFIVNSGYVGEFDIHGRQILRYDEQGQPIPRVDQATGMLLKDAGGNVQYLGQGEKITVQDSKRLVYLVEHRLIQHWLENPIFGYWIPDPRELEEVHGMRDFRRRFNLLRYYTPEEILAFAQRDIAERTAYLDDLFRGQGGYEELRPVIEVWKRRPLPSPDLVRAFYEEHFGSSQA